eukprot:28434_1
MNSFFTRYRPWFRKISSQNFSTCNSNFFNTWNPTMAYWLGFLFADGNVYKAATISNIQLGLKCIDYGHVAKYKTALQSTYTLALYKTNFGTCRAAHSITNNVLAAKLIQLGCIPRKSLTLEWPKNIPDKYVHHFVRGYFDGDGSIQFCLDRKAFVISFVGTNAFIHDLQSYVKTLALINLKARGCVSQNSSCHQLSYGGNKSSIAVLNWMYKDSDESTRLSRKYALYCKFLEISDLKPKDRVKPMRQFLESDIYTTLMQCQHQHCCPQLCSRANKNKNYRTIQQILTKVIYRSVLKEWTNASTIQKTLGFPSGDILKVCRTERYSAYGYKWKFLDNAST